MDYPHFVVQITSTEISDQTESSQVRPNIQIFRFKYDHP